MNEPLPMDLDNDSLPVGNDRVTALWVHGLLRGLSDSEEAREARIGRVLAALDEPMPMSPVRRITRRLVAGTVVAAALMLALSVFLFESSPAQASVESLLREAKVAHAAPIDRCYRFDSTHNAEVETLARWHPTYLWTRGDQFWMAIEGRFLALGLDQKDGTWIARTPQEGIRFDHEEPLPDYLALTCSICTMKIETLLDDVLRDFDVQRRDAAGDLSVDVLTATLKPGRKSSILAAELRIDRNSHVVQRLELTRRETTVTYTLVETRRMNEDQYTLKGHLAPGAKIYTRSRNPERRQILLNPERS